MPILHWIGKDKVINHHLDVPFKVLEQQYHYPSEVSILGNESPSSGNKIIHGDNLEALKALLPEYEGKIKCIYIDPPYNTGNEGWAYNDNVNDPKIKKWLSETVGKEGEDLTRHDKWLCMMYPRLKLLHKLLAEDGAIFISIDDNEQANLKLICDEIFGIGNFVSNIIWEKNYSPRNDAKFFSASHDFIITYSKNKIKWNRNLLPRGEKQNKFYKYNDNDGRGNWRPDNILVKTFSESGVFEIFNTKTGKYHLPPKGSCYRISREKANSLLEENKIYFGKDGKGKPQLKRYLSEVIQGVVPQTIWKYDEVGHNQIGKKELNEIFEDNVFDTPKPSKLIEAIIKLSSNKGDIILDSFAGSGTTAHAVMNLNKQDGGNRKFILIEMEDYAKDITAERVKRVISGYADKEGTGGNFDYYELGESLFDEDGLLNQAVAPEKIRSYIYYTETKKALANSTETDNAAYLGMDNQTAYYFHYTPNETTSLNHDFLATIKTKAEQYIIYADNCNLAKSFLNQNHIIFKKIPRDITRF
ncbi:MAG: type III restriction endonuclease subunit M [Chitinophagaceae bacterium BSSC1]|nr:MAG: type III restriction endonuclease subunit M [Chitinophagaceae bacterium BSSC1]